VSIEIVDYTSRYRLELVDMWRASFQEAVGVVDANPIEDQRKFFDKGVLPENRVVVAIDSEVPDIVAFMASTPEQISQLYVRLGQQRRGIGSVLLNRAKSESRGRLRLFTFAANQRARRFYEHHGFKAIRYGFEQHWQLEDVEYQWSEPGA
jgi:GNAT superfamily N-acetyltransferase